MEKSAKKIIVYVLIIIILAAGLIFVYFYNKNFSAVEKSPFTSSRLNILLTGSDDSDESEPRSDTIIIASIDLESEDIGLLSIPRDTYLEIPGHGKNKINASYAYGGIDLVIKTLESYLDIPIDYYVDLNFAGFSRAVDVLGGIEIDIEKDLNYVDEAADLEIDISKGRQQLDGEEALDYVRYRGPIHGDIGRVHRQQKFLKSAFRRLMQPDVLVKLPSLYNEFSEHVETNISSVDFAPFLKLIKQINMDHLKMETLPGEPRYIDEVSYWVPEENEVEILINSLIRSKEYIKNSQFTVSVLNGNGVNGTAQKAATMLERYGFKIEDFANAEHFDYGTTVIEYYDPQDKTKAQGIQKLIGGQKVLKEEQEKEGFRIILGKDFTEKTN
ncbi:MAG: LCP family protein [Bacillota bacterium]